jgi:hypothetical protein
MRGGPDFWTSDTHWSRWTITSAQGSGKLYAADANIWFIGHVRLDFSDVKTSSNDVRYYSRLHIVCGHRNGGITHYWHWIFVQHNWVIRGQS